MFQVTCDESSTAVKEEKPVVIVEATPVEDISDDAPKPQAKSIGIEAAVDDEGNPIAESRAGDASINHHDIPDQLAVESIVQQRHYQPGFSIQSIPVPVPMKVLPGKLVIPAPPQNEKKGSKYGAHGAHGGHRKVSNPEQFAPPPPVFKQAHHSVQQGHHQIKPHHAPHQAVSASIGSPKFAVPPPHQNQFKGGHSPSFNSPPPIPQSNYAPPPPLSHSSQPNYAAPLPPPSHSSQPNYAAPRPPPSHSSQPNYAVPPPRPNVNYNSPPPPKPTAPNGYGTPKSVDVHNRPITAPLPTNNYKVPPPFVNSAPPSAQNIYNAPPPAPVSVPLPVPQAAPAPVPVLAPVPVPAPIPTETSEVSYSPPKLSSAASANNNVKPATLSIPDADVSGSAIVQPNAVLPTDPWLNNAPEMPQITALDVKCEKNLMKINIEFDKPFFGIIFSKGHYSNVNCVHLAAGLGRTSANFDISINSCGTTGNTENGLYGYGSQSGSGTYFENTIVVQYDPQVQEVWDQARKLRCTWHDQYEKAVTFRPFPVDMLNVVPADFAGDNVGCWMQIQVGKGPWASEVSGLVKIGQTMTMVLAIKDDDNKFDMLVRNCMAHDGKRAPIQLVDQRGCVTRPKLMSSFTKIKNFGASASVLSYAYFQAFKFPDSMEVHFQCTIQICRYQCPDQCHSGSSDALPGTSYEASAISGKRSKRETKDEAKDIGVNRIIQVVSTRDLTFIPEAEKEEKPATYSAPLVEEPSNLICMSTPGFTATLIILLAILIISCLASVFLCFRFRGHSDTRSIISSYDNPVFMHKKGHF